MAPRSRDYLPEHHGTVLITSWSGRRAWRRRGRAIAQRQQHNVICRTCPERRTPTNRKWRAPDFTSISGLVVEYIVAIDVTRVRFPADALLLALSGSGGQRKRAMRTRILWWPLPVALCWQGCRRSRRQGGWPPHVWRSLACACPMLRQIEWGRSGN